MLLGSVSPVAEADSTINLRGNSASTLAQAPQRLPESAPSSAIRAGSADSSGRNSTACGYKLPPAPTLPTTLTIRLCRSEDRASEPPCSTRPHPER